MTETPSDYYWCYRHQLDVRSAEDRELHKAAAGPRTKHDPDTHEWEAVCLVPGCEAAAGPRDEGLREAATLAKQALERVLFHDEAVSHRAEIDEAYDALRAALAKASDHD